MEDRKRTIIVEGRRFLPHSYSLVSHYISLELLTRQHVALYYCDLESLADGKHVRHLLGSTPDAQCRNIPAPLAGMPTDATLRLRYPFDLSTSDSTRTAIFATCEYGSVVAADICGGQSLVTSMERSDLFIVTPSNWSREGFLASGALPDRIEVIPLGFDPHIFHPVDTSRRAQLRKRAGVQDQFVFLSVGAMTGNKNVPLLLRAFAAVAAKHPRVLLVLKGLDRQYDSARAICEATKALSVTEMARIQPRIRYVGQAVCAAELAMLYQVADTYVTPYAAEGFNLPALEAAASGLPLICTAGGPTDEFTTAEFALYVEAKERSVRRDGCERRLLWADLDHLICCMETAISNSEFQCVGRIAASAFVHPRFQWRDTVDALLSLLFDEERSAHLSLRVPIACQARMTN